MRHWQSCSFGIFRSSYASLKSKCQRAFLDFGDRYAHQIFGTNVNFSGSYGNATTLWLGIRNRWPDPSSETIRFVEYWSNSVRFSTFLRAEWKFSRAVCTTTRCFCCTNRKWERSSPLRSNKLRAQDFQTMHFLCLKMLNVTSFSHRISPGLPESATNVADSVLWVGYAWGNTVHCFFTSLHVCTSVFWVPFRPYFHFFFTFLAPNRTFITTEGQNTACRALYQFSRAL